ncbi:MAG TPA: HDOD domain-containing protein [Candidatus Hydrogenedentes bacterium]|nr:HDOD domain-containing protein [Candidatus Hydrogenedentota bacterium]
MIIDAEQRIVQCPNPKCGAKFRVPPNLNAPNFICNRCKHQFANPFAAAARPAAITRRERTGSSGSPSTSGLDSFSAELRDAKLVEPDQMKQAISFAKENGCKVYEALVRLNFITWDRLHEFLSKHPGITPFNVAGYSVDRDVLKMIPRELAQSHMVIPVTRLGQLLTVAMVCPLDMDAIEAVRQATNMKIRPVLCSYSEYQGFIQKHYRTPEQETKPVPGMFGLPGAGAGAGTKTGAAAAAASGPQPAHSGDGSSIAAGLSSVSAVGVEKDLTEKYLQRIRELEYLEVPSRHASAISQLDETNVSTLRQLLALISSAPTLAAIILATTNSRAYGLEGKVESLPMALTLLGVEGTKVIVANAPQMSPIMERMLSPLFHHARRVSVMAASLAGKSSHLIGNVAQAAAVLYSVGSFVLAATDPEEYKKIDRSLWGAARAQAEKQVFGLHHGEVAELLFQEWRLPEILAKGAACYLNPPSAGDYSDLAGLVYLAVSSISPEGEVVENLPEEASAWCEPLGLSLEQVNRYAYQSASV